VKTCENGGLPAWNAARPETFSMPSLQSDPAEKRFFDMFDETTAHLTRAAQKFLDMVTVFDKPPQRSQNEGPRRSMR